MSCRRRLNVIFAKYGIVGPILIMLVTTLLMISLENSAETWDAIKEKRNFLKKRYASQNGSYNKTSNDNANIDDVETGRQFGKKEEIRRACPEDGSLLWVRDNKVSGPNINLASHSTPLGFVIKKSGIKGAGLGVWTLVDLPECLIFGPYTGETVLPDDDHDGRYAWEVYDEDGKVIHLVDAADTSKSNWLRYINCPPTEDDENLSYLQKNGKVYYRTNYMIPAGTELLVWYGDDYARWLGLLNATTTPTTSKH